MQQQSNSKPGGPGEETRVQDQSRGNRKAQEMKYISIKCRSQDGRRYWHIGGYCPRISGGGKRKKPLLSTEWGSAGVSRRKS